jgi:hypothetical protein
VTFTPGNNANPTGRPVGSRNKRTEEIFLRLEARGDKDPADLLSEIVTSENETKELRVQAANFLLPYKYGKRGSIPSPRYIEEPIDLPRPTSLDIANENIALISELKAQGRIDLDFADSLIADNRTIANNITAITASGTLAGVVPSITKPHVPGAQRACHHPVTTRRKV